jgi:hypothetical protein
MGRRVVKEEPTVSASVGVDDQQVFRRVPPAVRVSGWRRAAAGREAIVGRTVSYMGQSAGIGLIVTSVRKRVA